MSFKKYKPIYMFIVLSFLMALLPQGGYAQDDTSTPTLDKSLFLPLITKATTQADTYEVVPGFLNIANIVAAQAEQACGSEMEKFTAPSVSAAQAQDTICLLPGRFPVMVAKKNGVIQGYGLGGTQGANTRTSWNITSGTLGSIREETADVVKLTNWPQESGILALPDSGEVVFIRLNAGTGINAAGILEIGPNPATVFEFLENLLSFRDGIGTYLFTVPASQVLS
jgi:hypothetical protein